MEVFPRLHLACTALWRVQPYYEQLPSVFNPYIVAHQRIALLDGHNLLSRYS